MIISNSKKYIFIHINKTAGTSVTRALAGHTQWNDLVLGVAPMSGAVASHFRMRFNLGKHSTAQDVLATVGEDIWRDYYTFSFVRHPYARAVSLYTFVKKQVASRGWKRYLRNWPLPHIADDDLWKWPATQVYLSTENFSQFIQHELLRDAVGVQPQAQWLFDSDCKLMVNFVGKVENLAQGFAKVCKELQLPMLELGQNNRSNTTHWSKFYKSDADYQRVYELARSDFDLLGYDREAP
jgi:hypothetical protein